MKIKAYKGSIFLEGYSISEHKDSRDFCIKLVSKENERTYYLSCDTKPQLEELILKIKSQEPESNNTKRGSLYTQQQTTPPGSLDIYELSDPKKKSPRLQSSVKPVDVGLPNEIPNEDIKLFEEIGTSTFGKTCRGRLINSTDSFVVKQIDLSFDLEKELSFIMTQMSKFRHLFLKINLFLLNPFTIAN